MERKNGPIFSEARTSKITTVPKPESILQKYRSIGLIKDGQDSKLFWDFVETPSRLVRISIPKQEESSVPSDWIHLKVYRQQVTGMVLHQIILFSSLEMRRLLYQLPSIENEAENYYRNFYSIRNTNLQSSEIPKNSQTVPFPSPAEDAQECDKFWEIYESKRRKICISCVYYDTVDYTRTYFQFKLFTRPTEIDSFSRKGCVSVRVDEINKLISTVEFLIAEMVRESIRENHQKNEHE